MTRLTLSLLALLAHLALPCAQAGDFLTDSSGKLLVRNYYFDRDFRSGSGQSQAQEWAQGFLLKVQSGYTPGTFGFGLDASAMAGFKLDSSPDRVGTGLIPYSPTTREPNDSFAEAGLTAKFKVSKTELKVGQVDPMLPVILPVMSRLFPPTFRGVDLSSRDIEGLTLRAGRIDRINLRDSTNWQPLQVSSQFGRFTAGAESKEFLYAGGDWAFDQGATFSYYRAQLSDIYQQDYLGLLKSIAVGPGTLKVDLRFHASREDGEARAGRVDNRAYQYNLSYALAGHTLAFGQMHMSGDTALPYLAGTDVNVITEGSLVSEFSNPKERTWQARYQYDFAAAGIPGLSALYRYIDGRNVHFSGAGGDNDETERSWELAYVIQSGPAKGLGLRYRQGHYTSNYFRDVDEQRVNIDYTVMLF
ncbi:outer membrane porin, OprD family [Pseudomonas alkylphenolica]|uniref:Outer membrane porin, OprD family n=1 Tax=Pseudomonas alkylphenolica TaxID=237609 RepID=A0A443ZHJ1_9PSED|nr:OprD family porin [Pseudomonas alkylphenolica]RWU18217.1 outer membrane porin, OprD family [Pseudomonas alkylphenolica]